MNASLKIDLFLSAKYTHRETEFMIGVIHVSLEPNHHVIEPDTSTTGKNVLPVVM